ncbi:MAG: hypothetical protein ABIQ59_13170 [Nocardioidaceae bacterium]
MFGIVVNAIPFYLLALVAFLMLMGQGLLLAWRVVGVAFSTYYARFSRGSMVEALNEDFVRTARQGSASPGRC